MKDALETMARIVGDTGNIVGGTSGALETDFPTSVTNAFKDNPDGAQVIEGDFVESVITDSTPAEPETGFNVFDFPAIDGSGPIGGRWWRHDHHVQRLARGAGAGRVPRDPRGGGDLGQAGRILEREQERATTTAYEDPLLRETATAIADAETFRFDLSDLQPAAFGATVGQGLWKEFQDFLRNPDDVDGAAQAMEQSAARAF